jgi:hypothetical protein
MRVRVRSGSCLQTRGLHVRVLPALSRIPSRNPASFAAFGRFDHVGMTEALGLLVSA